MEIEALAGNTAAFDGGGEYADPAHPYTSDLDIFGDDSVFKILNRGSNCDIYSTFASYFFMLFLPLCG